MGAEQASYQEHPPADVLRPYVECYWTSSASASVGARRILPDGCIDILFDCTGGAYAEGMLIGTMRVAQMFDPRGPIELVAVRFKPGGAVPFLRCPAVTITDSAIELSNAWEDAERLLDDVRESPSAARRVRRLEAALLQRLERAAPIDRRVQAAVSLLREPGCCVDGVARAVDVSRQHLARLFRRHVGVGPKALARVLRLQRLLDLPRNTAVEWSATALDAGYCDQAHMISECQSLAGCTPTELLRR